MKKKGIIILILASLSLTFSSCTNNSTSKNTSTKSTKIEYNSSTDLPKQKPITAHYLSNNTSTVKDFKKDNNYSDLTKLINNYLSVGATFDYKTANENTLLKVLDYSSNRIKNNASSEIVKEQLEQAKASKISTKYVKTNINNVIYDSYDNSYFIDCTYYEFIKSYLGDLPQKNRYYQNKTYLTIIKENGKWVVNNSDGYSPVRAEQTETMYMLDLKQSNSEYISKNQLNRFKDLESAKNTVKEFFNVYYSQNYMNENNVQDNFTNFASSAFKTKMIAIANNDIEITKSRLLQTNFLDVQYNLINYSSYTNSYWITAVPKWHLSSKDNNDRNSTITSYVTLHLIKEGTSWKIDKLRFLSDNLRLN
ncbi:hypothetical protein BJV85_000357 [Clostridium acetobutylicum]|uniref:Predicted membrane protein n=1 Tax=Clostridium acetobutylicum (strain ATCC 824 / DSM 792 / JCM 1419 / IAM 19013 / LMG 5710 / NBRC 13948 / NRRL B-527 / VKM B-1787 / 2291 / W) TaxID=272562 RepID=Q97DD5_CLOAB|nr:MULTISPECIES: hypothetical protein [Clostridium]AAK81468.1 Predicted membrane protein [Clostridium acetobutylicum ATCC 824]ADZ22586.1 membrane protein [Clostridium acetobutylicum EA 2018]AEI32923.1 hypothetical protein SMB_G3584 [Clostridium acetobutylicum DSM 1731]AWV80859.1 hypothetical protein DK921_12260 [Clostridium acetobutylicum]MBC2393814.1 hypothetical protein [Clostridium acetobutylicum]